jgi:hypothetical protein
MERLAQESVSLYHAPALVTPYTDEGLALCRRVAERAGVTGVTLNVTEHSKMHNLP